MAKKETRNVTEYIPYHRDWEGYRWTDAGKYLISPNGERISAERLKGLLWRDAMELRRAGFASRKSADQNRGKKQLVKVVVIQLGEYRDMVNGRCAG